MSGHVPNGARPPRRAGFSLVELLVAVTLLGVVLGAVVSLAVAQQRAHVALEGRRAARGQLRDAALLLARELRSVADDAGDLRAAHDTLLDLVATTGGSVACAVAGPETVELPPAEPPETALTWWVAAPRPGDLALVLDAGAAPGEADDRWLALDVVAAVPSATACAGSPFAGDVRGGYRLTLAGGVPLPPTLRPGAPVTLARRRRWSHYRGSDGLWYLGLREWDGAEWGETQPAAGPLRRAGGTGSGLSVTRLDGGMRLVLRADPAVAWRAGREPVASESVRVLVGGRGTTRGAP
jgi:prepilin-type N-terminal cleavage/methylation domain-containing protein